MDSKRACSGEREEVVEEGGGEKEEDLLRLQGSKVSMEVAEFSGAAVSDKLWKEP